MSWPCHEPFPKAMTPQDLMRALTISRATYQRRAVAGDFDRFKVATPIGAAMYSGAKVQQWIDGVRVPVTRHFGAARRSA
ncbi:MAG: hypothetical protein NUW22_04955 [Acidobacteria bacterium]|nr:hypothetical protein [Acidobacteriota bacterium]